MESERENENRRRDSNTKRRKRRRRNSLDKEEPCEDEVTTLEVGCDTSDTLEFRSQCASSSVISGNFKKTFIFQYRYTAPISFFFLVFFFKLLEYSCHGRWTENETNFLITTPQSRTSIGAKRYCFIYKEVGGVIHFSSSSQSCVRNINTGVEGVLAFNATSLGLFNPH